MRFDLKRLRELRNMTQLVLAKKSGVAQGYISDLEAGRKEKPSVEIVVKLARALTVDVSEVLYLFDKPKPRRRRPEFKRRDR
jgi:XRE family transcriptional regulator, master regulator for biofilm formation